MLYLRAQESSISPRTEQKYLRVTTNMSATYTVSFTTVM